MDVRQKKLNLPRAYTPNYRRARKNYYICCIIFPKQGALSRFLNKTITLTSNRQDCILPP